MAKMISLGLEVAEVHRRYAEIHGSLFGAASFRQLIKALSGKGGEAYGDSHRSLVALLGLLEDLERRIGECGWDDRSTRGGHELQKALLDYCGALVKAIAGLAGICYNLQQDESGYRTVDGAGHSRFNQDKVHYDYARIELENLGGRLNRLFSSY